MHRRTRLCRAAAIGGLGCATLAYGVGAPLGYALYRTPMVGSVNLLASAVAGLAAATATVHTYRTHPPRTGRHRRR